MFQRLGFRASGFGISGVWGVCISGFKKISVQGFWMFLAVGFLASGFLGSRFLGLEFLDISV